MNGERGRNRMKGKEVEEEKRKGETGRGRRERARYYLMNAGTINIIKLHPYMCCSASSKRTRFITALISL